MELNCADIVHVAGEREQALLHFVVPNLDQVIVTTGDEHCLRLMEVNATYGA